MNQDLLTFAEARDYLRASRSTIYRLMATGALQGHKVGNLWRFKRENLDKCIRPESPVSPAPARVQ